MSGAVRRTTAAITLAISLVGLSFPSEGADSERHGKINQALVDEVFVPGYERFAGTAVTLNSAVLQLCEQPTGDTLKAARAAFHDSADAWQAVQFIRIGAIARQSRHERIQFWPDKRGRVGKHLNRLVSKGRATGLEPDAFGKSSVAVQGFPALERLLFAGDETLTQLTDDEKPVKRCAIAGAITANLSTIAGQVLSSWRAGEKQLDDPTEALGLMFTDIATAFRAIADLKLGEPAGIKSGRVKARRAENWRAGRSLRNIVYNIEGLKRAYGVIADVGGIAGTPEETFIRQQFDVVAGDARALGPSLGEVLRGERGRNQVLALNGGVRDLADLVIGYVVDNLNLAVGFTSLDGD